MNGKRYEEIIEQYERTQKPKDQRECIFTMVKMMARNHLPHLEKLIKLALVVGLVNLLKPEGWDITSLIEFLIRHF